MPAQAKQLTVTLPADNQIVLTRQFDAARELVWRVITDPKLIPRWWGVRRHSTTVDQMDVRPGGQWRFVCRDDQGNTFAFRGEYKQIVAPEKIVQTFEFEPMPGFVSNETMTLSEKNGKTTLVTTSLFKNKQERDGMLGSGMEEGAGETYDRLEELLATLQ